MTTQAPNPHIIAADALASGITRMKTRECDPKYPTYFDMQEALDVLGETLKSTAHLIGESMYSRNGKKLPFDFTGDVMNEMKEIYVHDPYKGEMRWSAFIKNVVEPLLDRFALFSHEAAISVSDTLIGQAKTQLDS
jgi:hypothetical protein